MDSQGVIIEERFKNELYRQYERCNKYLIPKHEYNQMIERYKTAAANNIVQNPELNTTCYQVTIVLLGIVVALIPVGECITCLSCTGAVSPDTCQQAVECGSGEQCATDGLVTATGALIYDLGCRDNSRCTTQHGKRNANRTRSVSAGSLFCFECCDTDLCNAAGCGHPGLPSTRGPVCYTCPDEVTPDRCNVLRVCRQHQVCMIKLNRKGLTGHIYYESLCEDRTVCEAQLSSIDAQPIGKKRSSGSVHFGSQCILQCCDTDLCNRNCAANSSNSMVVTSPGFTTSRTSQSSTTPSPSSTSMFSLTTAMPFASSTTIQSAVGQTSPATTIHWTQWMSWSDCSRTCDGGVKERVRFRECSDARYPCSGHLTQSKPCNSVPCININTCLDILQYKLSNGSGVYRVAFPSLNQTVQVLCDMETMGGGWTVIQRKYLNNVTFVRNFTEYEDGFGSVLGDFWMGLKYIYQLAKTSPEIYIGEEGTQYTTHQTRITMYETFKLDAPPRYTVHVGHDKGLGWSYFMNTNGSDFYTMDHPDKHNCVSSSNVGWWHELITNHYSDSDHHIACDIIAPPNGDLVKSNRRSSTIMLR